MTRMTVHEYANKRGIRPGAVTKALRMGHNTPGLCSFEKFNRTYILYVNENKVVAKKPKKTAKKVL